MSSTIQTFMSRFLASSANCLKKGEVLGREVGGGHAAAGLRGDGVEVERLHGVEVVGQGLDGDWAVHAAIGLGAVLGGRVDPGLGNFGGGGHLDFLPGMAAGVG